MGIYFGNIKPYKKPKNNFNSLHLNFRNYLSSVFKGDQNLVDSKLEFGKKVISELENIDGFKSGLIVGHVQSGKTISFLSCIDYALQNEYDVVIVLTSIEKSLNTQTFERLKKAFVSDSNNSNNLVVFKNSSEFADNPKQQLYLKSEIESSLKAGKKVIITSLKNQKIANVANVFSQINYLNDKKVLIIDDEGDLASLSQTKKDDKFEDSRANSYINRLLATFNNKVFISVTATPYVHLFIHNTDNIQINRVFTIEPGKNYFGLDQFFQPTNKEKYFSLTDNIQDLKSDNLSEIFQEAILYHWIAHTIRFLSKESESEYEISYLDVNSNMLIHTEVKTNAHSDIRSMIINFRKAILNSICYDYDSAYLKTETSFEIKKTQLLNIVKKYYDSYPNVYQILSENYDIFIRRFIDILNTTSIETINNTSNKKDELIFTTGCNILIGSKKLERGITIPNLITSIYSNQSNNSFNLDTSLQRARWFGYREKIDDYLKIFTTNKIYEDFIDMKNTQDKIWSALKELEINYLPLDNIDWVSISWPNAALRLTSKRDTNVTKLLSVYTNNLIDFRSENIDNYLYKLFNKVKNDFINNSDNSIVIGNKLLPAISFARCEDFYDYIDFYNNRVEFINAAFRPGLFGQYTLWDLIIRETKINNANIVLVDMVNDESEDGFTRTRDFLQDQKSINLFQGRSSNLMNGWYCGDIYWNNEEEYGNTLFIQIHKIRYKKSNKIHYFLAILNPFSIYFSLKKEY